ncbi:MAG: ferredoxin [Candidatus Komeilibacteria bacterium CG11_big_fil_rev_8_21_14_0_20_36_20]|uniref:Ferredoxin n=1 Tax=Candidatus Komeilibacteria bacterium CG11_big_fil_rev_8_21_14_0_20_36_20 TaxID=1974477 RepID=A0A2H0NCG5_9BACT|nr:MAG: ferredoxin [Candidatus Komeilibacteria bacterium CG11_big_fil_rev_8_21_14_0_20_36_20]PIR81921.1 MAG: ferredoxin [Candidatus Komeilibacteria bacterium CG10_big_fil_rev_8_21_14_0_10_36_65]PJC55352.1 MAG: ferredoxin [Candidatus Komeilibacteria bacterium CG_4_9_14_0_2_um_filter_36_13]
MSKKYKITHQKKDCIGCGLCVELCPESWSIDEKTNLATLKGAKEVAGVEVGEIDEKNLADNLKAEEECPVSIIKIEKK